MKFAIGWGTVLLGVVLTANATGAGTRPPVLVPVQVNHDWFSPCFDGTAWRFKTGFEGTTQVMQSHGGKAANFDGDNEMDACGGKARFSMPQGFRLGRADIQYEGGDESERIARLVPDPVKPGNRVLQFWLAKPNVMGPDGQPLKGRVQMNLYENQGVRRLAMSVRMYLHPEMNLVRSYPEPIKWLTISEWWNNAGWTGEPNQFRMSVHIVKESADTAAPMRFMVKSDSLTDYSATAGREGDRDGNLAARGAGKSKNLGKKRRWDRLVWEHLNRDFQVPVGKWMTLEYGFVEGDELSGRFFMAVTVDGERRRILFDIRDYTHHPDDPAPDGLSHLNPVKLYTSSQLVNHVRRQGGALQILYDDLEIAACSDSVIKAGDACTLPGFE